MAVQSSPSLHETAAPSAYPLQHSSCAQLEEKRIPYTIEKINMQC